MAITQGTVLTHGSAANAGSQAFEIPAGTTGVLVFLSGWLNGTVTLSSISLGGQAMEILENESPTSDGIPYRGAAWLPSPPTGSQQLAWDFSGSTDFAEGLCIEVIPYTSDLPLVVRDSNQTAWLSSATDGVAVSSTATDHVVGMLCSYDPGADADLNQAGQTVVVDNFTFANHCIDIATVNSPGPETTALTGFAHFGGMVVVSLFEDEGGSVSVGEGTLSAGDSTVAGTGERAVTGTGALLVQSSAVSGSGALQLKLVLTQATNRNLVDESGAPVANLADIAYEWYDALDDTDGDPTQEGTFSTNENGEATIQLPNSSLTSGQSGTLILYHPTDSEIRGVYRIPVT